jgi:hypothetical protein
VLQSMLCVSAHTLHLICMLPPTSVTKAIGMHNKLIDFQIPTEHHESQGLSSDYE